MTNIDGTFKNTSKNDKGRFRFTEVVGERLVEADSGANKKLVLLLLRRTEFPRREKSIVTRKELPKNVHPTLWCVHLLTVRNGPHKEGDITMATINSFRDKLNLVDDSQSGVFDIDIVGERHVH
tara:strand:+ start:544 stop:915 length:372 start_codon:yes stop_codon:yes gene_type:complete